MDRSEIFPPHFEINDKFQRVIVNENEGLSLQDTKKSVENKLKFISNHPTPYFQGPFPKPIGMKLLNQTFEKYTTYTHSSALSCDQLNEGVANRNKAKVWGPASRLNGSILYNCEFGNCEVDCLCKLCQTPSKCIRKSCFDSPCSSCDLQCILHKITPMREFNEDNLFTIVAAKDEESVLSVYKKYPGVLKSCTACTENLKNHETFHKVFHFKCKFCRNDARSIENCLSSIDLRNRKNTISRLDNQTCSKCFRLFSDPYHRKQHEENAHSKPKYTCEICSQSFQIEKSLQRHIDDLHTLSLTGIECKVCGKVLSTAAILKRHEDTVHATQSYFCEKCDKNFSRKHYYHRHLKEVHRIQQTLNLHFAPSEFLYNYKCEECDKWFTRKESLERHKKSTHDSENKLFQCEFCKKVFNRKYVMKRHKKNCKHKI